MLQDGALKSTGWIPEWKLLSSKRNERTAILEDHDGLTPSGFKLIRFAYLLKTIIIPFERASS